MDVNPDFAFSADSLGISSANVYYTGNASCEPGHFWSGVRDTYLLHHIYAGEGIYRVNGKEYHLKAGDSFLARPGDAIFYQADTNNPWSYCWVGFQGSECGALLLLTDFAMERVIHTDFGTELKDCILDIRKKQGYSTAESLEMTAGLYRLMACLARHTQSHTTDIAGHKNGLQDVLRYISSKISYGESVDTLSVRRIAERFNMSESTLYRLFMAQMDISPVQYITKVRITQACRLLTMADESITSVAFSVGYPNGQCFAKNFRKVMGMSPSEYIKRHTKK